MNNNRGSVLVITLSFILIFTLFGFSSIYLATTQNEAAEKRIASTKAFWLADGGIQKTIWELKKPTNACTGFFQEGITAAACGTQSIPCVTAISCASCGSCGTSPNYSGNKRLMATIAGYGDYEIVLNDSNSNVKAKGWYPNRPSSVSTPALPDPSCVIGFSCRTIELDSGSPFDYAAFGKNKVTIGNNIVVDSYNSNIGPYGGANVSTKGHLGSNGAANPTIDLGQNVIVKGDVSTGLGGKVKCGSTVPCETGNPAVTGTITHNNNVVLDPDPVVVPSTLTSLSSEGPSTISGTQTLSGSHKYTTMTMNNNSILNISGNVSLYLTSTTTAFSTGNKPTINIPNGSSLTVYTNGVFQFKNNATLNNVSQIAKNLQMFSTYTGSNGVDLSNNAGSSFAVYSPNTDVLISNNGDFAGAVIGKTISISGSAISKFHFDRGLMGTINDPAKKWQEL